MTSTVPAIRLAKLAKGVNCENLVNNIRKATYLLADLVTLRGMGATYVRVPWDVSQMVAGTPTDWVPAVSTQADVDLALKRLDQFIADAHAAHLAVVLCPFVCKAVYALGVEASQAIILQAADIMTARYAPTIGPWRLFFECVNEPHYDNATWNAFAPKVVAALRKGAPRHTIIVPPAWWSLAENFKDLTPIDDTNVVYTMHCYQPAQLTQQGAGGGHFPDYVFPRPAGSTDKTEWTEAKMDAYFKVGVDWAAAHGVPLILGEFGCSSAAPASRMVWLRFVRAAAEKYGIGWALWGFDGRMFGLKPHTLGGAWDADLVAFMKERPGA